MDRLCHLAPFGFVFVVHDPSPWAPTLALPTDAAEGSKLLHYIVPSRAGVMASCLVGAACCG